MRSWSRNVVGCSSTVRKNPTNSTQKAGNVDHDEGESSAKGANKVWYIVDSDVAPNNRILKFCPDLGSVVYR